MSSFVTSCSVCVNGYLARGLQSKGQSTFKIVNVSSRVKLGNTENHQSDNNVPLRLLLEVQSDDFTIMTYKT